MHIFITKSLLYFYVFAFFSSILFVWSLIFKRPNEFKKVPFLRLVSSEFINKIDDSQIRSNIKLVKIFFVLTLIAMALIFLILVSYYIFLQYSISNP